MLLGHPFIGYLTGKLYQEKYNIKLTESQQLFWNVIAVIFAIGPDFDFFVGPAVGVPTWLHRYFMMHTPFFWLAMFGIIWVAYRFLGSYSTKIKTLVNPKFVKHLITLAMFNSMIHLVVDILIGGIKVLYPFSNTMYTVFGQIMPYPADRTTYFLHPLFIIEILVLFMGIMVFLSEYGLIKVDKNWSVRKIFGKFKFFTYIWAVFFVAVTALYFNTYIPTSESIDYKPDYDFDMIKNLEDNDNNQNGIINITDTIENNSIRNCLHREVSNLARKTPISLPQSYAGNTSLVTTARAGKVITDNLDLVSKVYTTCGFLLSNDLKYDVIQSPTEYGISGQISSYNQTKNLLTLKNVYYYVNKHAQMPTDLEAGDIIFTKDANDATKPVRIYMISNVAPGTGEITALTTTDSSWHITEIIIDRANILEY